MLTKLLFPPQWIPTQPYLSLPSLAAFLQANGCDVEQMDINVVFYDNLLSRQSLRDLYEKAYLKFQELDSRKELTPELQKQYAALGSSMLFGEYIIEEVEEAKKILRDKEYFYNLEQLFSAFRILELGLKLASSAYYPTNLTFHAYDMRYSCRSSKEVLAAMNDREANLFIDYFEKNTLNEVLRDNPGFIGISIINTSQIIPGLTLAALIKKADEDIHVNIGGSVFTRLIKEISRNKELFSIVDSVIVHEGETPLLNLIGHFNNEFDIKNIPNLIYKEGSEIRTNKISSEGEDVNSLPTPSFEGFPLELYFSPELVLPVLSSRGCYWRRCTFCDHGYGYSGKYRPRDVELLYNDIKALKNRYKTSFFTFQDEGISPKLIGSLSDKIIKDKLEISWLADSRFEAIFSSELCGKIAEAGCKMIYFGLESANKRILACMDKGIEKEDVLKICRHCTDAGIWTHLFLIFGFPAETMNEALETMDFILQNKKIIRSVAFGSFQLTKHSRVHEAPALFHVNKIIQNDDMDFSLWHEYEVSQGMSKKEIDEAINKFYNELSRNYMDLQLWSNLDREHLFLYVSHYKKAKNKVANLENLIDRIHRKRTKQKPIGLKGYPVLNEGVFAGTFNFNLAKIIHEIMAGNTLNLQKENTNVLFDTNNNRIFTVTDFAKFILDICKGELNLSEIVNIIEARYNLPHSEAEVKCKNLLTGLMQKNIIR